MLAYHFKKILSLKFWVLLYVILLIFFFINLLTDGIPKAFLTKLNQFWSFYLYVDNINTALLILTAAIGFVTVLVVWNNLGFNKPYSQLIFNSINVLTFLAFLTTDLLLFYLLFETLLIPISFLIYFYGSRARKIKAIWYFLFFTLVSSVFFLIAIGVLYFYFNQLHFAWLEARVISLPLFLQYFIWFSFTLAFLVKTPTFPFHLWLPEAHVEAPTAGSIILAGVLLKLGTFGLLKYSLLLFPSVSVTITLPVALLALLSIFYGSFIPLRQLDIKRIIAYASVAHINIVVIGLFSFTTIGWIGSLLIIVAHGFVSSALFYCVGVLYETHHSRLLLSYSGLVTLIPIFTFFFFFFTIANFSLPPLGSFVSELLILTGVVAFSKLLTILLVLSTILTLAYSLWLFIRLNYGLLTNFKNNFTYTEITRLNFYVLVFFLTWTFLLGLIPQPILNISNPLVLY